MHLADANGLVAQLEERRNGIAEVVSSNLIGSTIFSAETKARTNLALHFLTAMDRHGSSGT